LYVVTLMSRRPKKAEVKMIAAEGKTNQLQIHSNLANVLLATI